MIPESVRKQMLASEITILTTQLNEMSGLVDPLPSLSKADLDGMEIQDLETMKRELRDLSRTLGGARGR